jgi:hypothetical protein
MPNVVGVVGSGSGTGNTGPSRAGIAPWRPPGMVAVPFIAGPIGNPPVLGGSGVIRAGGGAQAGSKLPGPVGNPPVLGGSGVIRAAGPGGSGGQVPGPIGNPPVLGGSGVIRAASFV